MSREIAVENAEMAIQYAPELAADLEPLLAVARQMVTGTVTQEEIVAARDAALDIYYGVAPGLQRWCALPFAARDRLSEIGFRNPSARFVAWAAQEAIYENERAAVYFSGRALAAAVREHTLRREVQP